MKKDRDIERAEIWISKAGDDLLWAKDTLKDQRYGGVCFLAQQATEKALKAYLFSKKQKLIRTHNLERLLEKCALFEKEFLRFKDHCQIINRYYTDTRYPDIWDIFRFEDKKLAAEALELAKEVVRFVEERMKTR